MLWLQPTLAAFGLGTVIAGAVVGYYYIRYHLHVEAEYIEASLVESGMDSTNPTSFLVILGLLPLLNYAGADIWESFSAAGALNPLFGLMIGSPIGSLGMFKAGLKKLFPEQVKILDWTCMDVLGSRARFRRYKLFMSSPSAIDSNRDFQSSTFLRTVETNPHDGSKTVQWGARTRNDGTPETPETIEGYDNHPIREHLHGDNDDLLHMGPHETVVTFESVSRFEAALIRNVLFATTLSVITIFGMIVPLIALEPRHEKFSTRITQYPPSQLYPGVAWAILAFIYACLSALTGYLALRITTSKDFENQRRETRGFVEEEGDKELREGIIRTYWQDGKDEYRMGLFFTDGIPFVQHGLYGNPLRRLSLLQGFVGILLAVAAGLCTIAVTNAEVTIFFAAISPGLKARLALWPLIIFWLRFMFVVDPFRSTRLCPRLDGQDIVSREVVKAIEPTKKTWTVDEQLQKRLLQPLRMIWLEKSRIVFKTTQHGGYWRYFSTKMVLEPNIRNQGKSGLRLILPSACLIDGSVLRNLVIQLQRQSPNRKTTAMRPRDFDSIWNTSIIREDATYFLKFTRRSATDGYLDAKAILVPSQPWSSEINARGTLFAPSWATESAPPYGGAVLEDELGQEEAICLMAKLPREIMVHDAAENCPTCERHGDFGNADQGKTRTTLYRPQSSLPKGFNSKRRPGEATVRHIHGHIPFDNVTTREPVCISRRMTVREGDESSRILRKVVFPPLVDTPLTLWIYDQSQHRTSEKILADLKGEIVGQYKTHPWKGDDLLIVEPGQEYKKETAWRKVCRRGAVLRWYLFDWMN